MKDITSGVSTSIAAREKTPIVLFELELTGVTLRYAATISNISFGGYTWTAKAVQVDNVEQSPENTVSRITVKFDNIARDMLAYANTYTFENKILRIKRIYLSGTTPPTSADDYIEVFRGTMEQPKDITMRWFSITAVTGKGLRRKIPTKKYERQCNHAFGDTDCNTNGFSGLTTLHADATAQSGATNFLVDAVTLSQTTDYWKYGRVQILYSSVTYTRYVDSFDGASSAVHFDVALSFAVDNTCSYLIEKGCGNTWDDCKATNAWGPSSDNKKNFGGFLHIGTGKYD